MRCEPKYQGFVNNALKRALVISLTVAVTSCGHGGSDSTDIAAGTGPPPVVENVIVVGAGLAGLTAARDLQAAGLNVTVIEARDRIGGRAYTDNSTGIPLDMGASWILGIDASATYELAVEAGVAVSGHTDWDIFQGWDFDGSAYTISDADDADFFARVEAGCRQNYQNQTSTSFEVMTEAMYANGDFPNLNRREFEYLVATHFELEYAGDVSLMSASQCWEGSDYFGDDVIIPGGYSQLPEFLSNGLDIRLNTVVTAVTYDNQGVTLTTTTGDFRSDRAVITVPIGVLRSGDIQFSPALPQSKLDAINLIGSGTLNKTWMIFPSAFWDTDTLMFGYMSDPKGHFTEWYSFDDLETFNVLLAFNGGSEAIDMESMTDEEITAEAMAILRTMFGPGIPEPFDVIQTRWNSDPFSQGSYGFLAAGAVSSRDRSNLAENVMERLFFAGEATSATHYATTEGAIRSGKKAATDVIGVAN